MSNLHKQPNEEKKQIRIKTIEPVKEKKQSGSQTINDNQDVQNELLCARNELEEITKEKHSLIQETKEKITQEQNNWETEKHQWIEQAKEQGFNEGFSLGKEESLGKYKHLLVEANVLSETALKDYQATIEKSTETILDIAIHTAKRILNEKFTEDPDSFLDIVYTAIQEIKDQPVISIYLHPKNFGIVLQQKEELIQLLENDAKLSIYTRENIAENSCLIEHPFGQIDASVDTQLQQIRSALHIIAMENKL